MTILDERQRQSDSLSSLVDGGADGTALSDQRRSSALIGLAVGSAAVSVAIAVIAVVTLVSGTL